MALTFSAITVLTGCNAGNSAPGASNLGGYPGHLYAQTNAANGNMLVHYGRSADGVLHFIDQTSTGGNGVGFTNLASNAPGVDPLFSNFSVMLAPDRAHVFAVNAGSNTVSSFTVTGTGSLQLVGAYPTGGLNPTSVAVSGSTVYVSHEKPNAAGQQLFGFHLNSDGSLTAINGAQYAPSAATISSEVRFSPNGSFLQFIELMTGVIAMYPVNADGTLGTPVRNTSVGAGPFGSIFLDDTHVFVSEVHPGQKQAGSVTSYAIDTTGKMTPISSAVLNRQDATCWLRVSTDGRYLFASNTSSSNVSVYAIGSGATLTLASPSQAYLAPQGGTTDFLGNPSSGPVDLVMSADGQYLYQEYSGLGRIAAYRIGSDGSLSAIANGDGLNLPTTGNEGVDGY